MSKLYTGPFRLPDLGFSARIADNDCESVLLPCRRLWRGTRLSDPALDTTHLDKMGWATLFAYMHRRFGPPSVDGDPFKDLSAGWLLDTPDAEVFVIVSPSPSGPGFSLVPLLSVREVEGRRAELPELSAERVSIIRAAFEVTVVDLMRPVRVGNESINALGIVGNGDYNDALLESDGNTEEVLHMVSPYAGSGQSMPPGLFGGSDWSVLCRLVANLGGGYAQDSIQAGRAKLVALLQREAIDYLSRAPWTVKCLVLLGAGSELPNMLRHAGMDPEMVTEAGEDISQISRRTDRGRILLSGMTDKTVNHAIDILGRLGFEASDLRETVRVLRFDMASNDAYDSLMRLVGDRFPDEALPSAEDSKAGDLTTLLREGVMRADRADIAAWIDTTVAVPNGDIILGQMVAYLRTVKARRTTWSNGMAP